MARGDVPLVRLVGPSCDRGLERAVPWGARRSCPAVVARAGTKRFPKRGFSNQNFERRYYVVNIQDIIAQFDNGATVDAAALKGKGFDP